MAVASVHAPVPGRADDRAPHLVEPQPVLREEHRGRHRARELTALHGLGSFVGRLELRVHPLVAEEARAVLGDAVAAHQAYRLPHHRRAVAGVPELDGRPQHRRHGVEHDEAHHRILGQGVEAARAARLRRLAELGQVLQRVLLSRLEGPPLRTARRDALLGEVRVHRPFQRVEFVEDAGGREPERGGRFTRRPDVDQPVERVLFLLQPQFEPPRSGLGGIAAAEPAAMVADDGLHGRDHLRRRHQAHGDPRPAEHGVEDLAVCAVGHQDPVLDRVAADDAARRHTEAEHGVAGGGQLMDELAGPHAGIEGALVGLLEQHERGALDAIVGGGHGRRHEVGVAHARDEPAPLVDLQDGLFAGLPLGDAHLAVEVAGVDADMRQRFGQHERAVPRLALLPRLARRHQPHVARALVVGAALVDRRQGEHVAEHGRGRAGIDPRQFEGGEGDAEVLRAVDPPAVLAVDREDREAGGVERLHEAGLVGRPGIRMPRAAGHQPRHGPTRDGARGLRDAAEVLAIRKSPLNRADIIVGQASKHRQRPSVRKPGTPWVPGRGLTYFRWRRRRNNRGHRAGRR